MTRGIFISLPVSDVARSAAFYEAIGFEREAALANPRAAAMRWGEAVTLNLMAHDLYALLTPKPIADAHANSAVLFALPLESRAAVDAISAAAVAAGGREVHGAEDEGFLYSRGFEDPDGHAFGPFHMDETSAGAPAEDSADQPS